MVNEGVGVGVNVATAVGAESGALVGKTGGRISLVRVGVAIGDVTVGQTVGEGGNTVGIITVGIINDVGVEGIWVGALAQKWRQAPPQIAGS